MSISSRQPAPVQAGQRTWRDWLAPVLGLLALLTAACIGSFAAAHAAQPIAAVAAEGDAGGAADTRAAANHGDTQQAHWVRKKIFFTYQGFTTHYSCDGLVENVRQILLELGARKSDLNVHETGCTRGFGAPEPSPSVAGSFSVLEPGSASTSSATARHPVKAEWQTVHVQAGRRGLDAAGQCELIDQVKAKILPLFATRDVRFESNCVPHQLMIKGSTLTVQVLKPAHGGTEVAEAPHQPGSG